ncbi:MAG: hypothetical protein MJ110_04655 [Lachnospiraceae bacterium]|nr:hypothetical protein [Lachnospiraceae bacterium]
MSKNDYLLITPHDVARLIWDYRVNRRDTLALAKKLWYNERKRLALAYRTNLKLFIGDLQFILNLIEENDSEEIEEIKSEIENTLGENKRGLFTREDEIGDFTVLVQFLKDRYLLLLYFEPIVKVYTPKAKYSRLVRQLGHKYSQAQIAQNVNFCLDYYSLQLIGPYKKVLKVEELPLDYDKFVTCILKKQDMVNIYNHSDKDDLNVEELSKYVAQDFSGFTINDFWSAFR